MVARTQQPLEAAEVPFRILFLGGHNTGRSAMAEAFLRTSGVEGCEVESAGVIAGTYTEQTRLVMREAGIDISPHQPRALSDLRTKIFDLVVLVCNSARDFRSSALAVVDDSDECPTGKHALVVGAPVHLDWYVRDPAAVMGDHAQVLQAYREVRDVVQQLTESLVQQGFLQALAGQHRNFERFINSLDDGLMAHDESGHIFLFNSAAERLTGYSRHEVLGHHCHAVFMPDGLCGAGCPLWKGERHVAETRPDYKMQFVSRQGDERRLHMIASPMLGGPGGASGVILKMRDITEVSQLRSQLKQRRGFAGMVGISPSMQEVFETIRQVTLSDYPVLVSGESGTGKELVARAIHDESRRSGAAFIALSCGALPEPILESELFGHVRGAFTGAIRDKKGRFELAHRGTLFLDEVGELTPAFQVKLLRVLQEKRFEQLGGERQIEVDVRVIAATNRDLREMVRSGQFREDLYYRLCVVPIELPPLRNRREDLPLLIDKLLQNVRDETHKPLERISDDAMDLMLAYSWPGNVRELQNALQFAAVRCHETEIGPRHLPLDVRIGRGLIREAPPPEQMPAPTRRGRRRVQLDRGRVERALAASGGNKAEAARILAVGRATLYRYLDRLDIDAPALGKS